MKYIQLNNTDLNISPICLGTAGFGDKSDLEKSFEILNAFVWAGGNFIDTANVYCKWLKGHGNCSEQIIGKWLKESGMQGKVIVATKGAHYSFEDPGRSRVNKEDIRMDLDESCRTLGKDEMDFYWLHRDDPEKPAEEIVDILEELKKEGRRRRPGWPCRRWCGSPSPPCSARFPFPSSRAIQLLSRAIRTGSATILASSCRKNFLIPSRWWR